MLTLLFSFLTASAEVPAASIVVTDSRYEEIYFEDPRVMCNVPCSFDQDTSTIFVEANRHHKSWVKKAKISGIYNDDTIKYAYGDDCNFKKDPHGCANQNGLWVMRTTISVDKERASINIMIFDENAAMIGQGTFTRFAKTRIIERKKVTQQQTPGQPMTVGNCNKETGNCATVPVQTGGQVTNYSEDLEPTIIEIPPTITARDIGQAMIMAYDSTQLTL